MSYNVAALVEAIQAALTGANLAEAAKKTIHDMRTGVVPGNTMIIPSMMVSLDTVRATIPNWWEHQGIITNVVAICAGVGLRRIVDVNVPGGLHGLSVEDFHTVVIATDAAEAQAVELIMAELGGKHVVH